MREPKIWRWDGNTYATMEFIERSKPGDQLWVSEDFGKQLGLNVHGVVVLYSKNWTRTALQFAQEHLTYKKIAYLDHKGDHPPPPELMAQAQLLAAVRGLSEE
jgi:hypothetical protein